MAVKFNEIVLSLALASSLLTAPAWAQAPQNSEAATHAFGASRPIQGRYIVVFTADVRQPAQEARLRGCRAAGAHRAERDAAAQESLYAGNEDRAGGASAVAEGAEEQGAGRTRRRRLAVTRGAYSLSGMPVTLQYSGIEVYDRAPLPINLPRRTKRRTGSLLKEQ